MSIKLNGDQLNLLSATISKTKELLHVRKRGSEKSIATVKEKA